MPQRMVSIPDGSQPFTWNKRRYRGGAQMRTSNPCEALAFAQAFNDANPGSGRRDSTPGFWQSIGAACPNSGNEGTPASTPPPPAKETKQNINLGGDSAEAQGAPALPGGTADGSTVDDAGTLSSDGEPQRLPPGEPTPRVSGERSQFTIAAADPVDLVTGAFTLQEADLEVPNVILPLAFVRFYRSGVAILGPLGWNWDHSLNIYLRELTNGDVAVWRHLREDIFHANGIGFDPPRGIFEVLERSTGLGQAWELSGEGGTVLRFERPTGWTEAERVPLVVLKDRHGNAQRFAYDSENRLAEVRDDDGRFLRFGYDNCGLLVSVIDAAGRAWGYKHDEQTMQLTRAVSPPITGHPSGIVRVYHYADPWTLPELRHNIIRVEDAAHRTFVENVYDEDPASESFARLVEQHHSGYLYQFRYTALQAVPPDKTFVNIGAFRVEVMNPDFGLETYTFNYRGDLLDRRFRLVRDRSFRVVAIQYRFDEQGNLEATTLPDGSAEITTYDAANPDPRMRGKLLRRERRAGSGVPTASRIVWRATYEPRWQLLREERAETGVATRYIYDEDETPGAPSNTGKLKRVIHPIVTLPDGTAQPAETRFEHNARGQVTAVIHPDGTSEKMSYGTTGAAASRLIAHSWDPGGLGIVERIGYNAAGHENAFTDGNGNVSRRLVNALGLVEREDLPAIDGAVASYVLHYDGDRRVTRLQRPRGDYDDPVLAGAAIEDRFERDVAGNLVRAVFAANTATPRAMHSFFDHRGFPIRSDRPNGSRIDRLYDERGLLLEEAVTGADGARLVRRLSYDRNGRLVRETGPGDTSIVHAYDSFGRVRRVTMPDLTEFRSDWGPGDVLLASEVVGDDGSGRLRRLTRASFSYDRRLRRTAETVEAFEADPTLAVALTTRTFYDVRDRPVRTVTPRGGVTRATYDAAGRIVSRIDTAGNEERWKHDANSNIIEVESRHLEPDGSVSVLRHRQVFDARDRLVASLEPDGTGRHFVYDARDLPVRETDAIGHVREMGHNALGARLAEVVDASGIAATHAWSLDAMGQPIAYIDPSGETTVFQYDGLGRLILMREPGGRETRRSFGEDGRIMREASASGLVFDFEHDTAGRLVALRNPAAPPGVTLAPDHLYRWDGLGRLVEARAGAMVVRRAHDSQGRITREETGGVRITRAWDDLAGTCETRWPDGRLERHVLDLAGRIVQMDEPAHGALGSGAASLARIRFSGPVHLGSLSLASGVTLTASYDDRKRLVELAVGSAGAYATLLRYGHDTANRTRIESCAAPAVGLRWFDYDTQHRLIGTRSGFTAALPVARTQPQQDNAIAAAASAAMAAPVQEVLDYDSTGVRLSYRRSGAPPRVYTYAPGHRATTDGLGSIMHSADGVRVDDGRFAYGVDALGRVVSASDAAGPACQIEYDALGRPAVLHERGRPVRLLHYLGNTVVQEDEGGVAARQVTTHPGLQQPMLLHLPGATYELIHDGRSCLVAVLDGVGTLVEGYRYDAFGTPEVLDPMGATRAASALGLEPVFSGQRYLPSLGLYLSRRRLLDPVNGLYLSPDPRGHAAAASLYVYAAQNPVGLIDPEGEFPFLAVLAVMAVGALVAGGLNAVRQGIQMAEDPRKRAEGFSGTELLQSMGIGAIAAPVLVAVPELAIPLTGFALHGGVEQIANGNIATGTFDIVTALAPFGLKSVRQTTTGSGTLFRVGRPGAANHVATPRERLNRFNLIDNNLRNFLPAPGGNRVGLGFARSSSEAAEGHVAVILEEPEGGFWFVEKNAQRWPEGGLRADFNRAGQPPDVYYGRSSRPFEYDAVRIPRSAAERARSYARGRSADMPQPEPFDFGSANCSHFASDVLSQAGFRGLGNGRASGLWSDFTNFRAGVDASYSAPFWVRTSKPQGVSK